MAGASTSPVISPRRRTSASDFVVDVEVVCRGMTPKFSCNASLGDRRLRDSRTACPVRDRPELSIGRRAQRIGRTTTHVRKEPTTPLEMVAPIGQHPLDGGEGSAELDPNTVANIRVPDREMRPLRIRRADQIGGAELRRSVSRLRVQDEPVTLGICCSRRERVVQQVRGTPKAARACWRDDGQSTIKVAAGIRRPALTGDRGEREYASGYPRAQMHLL